jgi:protein cornichon
MNNEHLLDPTEILRFKNLRAARMESIVKTVFYGFQIVYGMFWCVLTAILNR